MAAVVVPRATVVPSEEHVMKVITRRPFALLTLLAICAAFGSPAGAVDQTVEFGAPTVLSAQGQRLKVVVPVMSPADDWATAASFMVRETEVPQGHAALPAGNFTVMRPAASDYVVFQSGDVVLAPEVSLIVTVAGDPRSPYRMDLQVPQAGSAPISSDVAGGAAERGSRGTLPTRRLQGPQGENDLPPK
jgi:hypothetical protein